MSSSQYAEPVTISNSKAHNLTCHLARLVKVGILEVVEVVEFVELDLIIAVLSVPLGELLLEFSLPIMTVFKFKCKCAIAPPLLFKYGHDRQRKLQQQFT
jgi:hypothetical protein